MALFRWQGTGLRGESLQGEMEAPSAEIVMVRLRAQRIRPLPNRIKEKSKGFDRNLSLPTFGSGVKPYEIVVFTRQLATMINAGLPIVQALIVLEQQSQNPVFARIIERVRRDVEGGTTFAASLGQHPKVFDNLYTNMIAAGEMGGILDLILDRLAVYMEKAGKLRKKLQGAMIYPASILIIAGGVTTVLLIYVIPVFAEMFASFGKALPLPTQIAITLSHVAAAGFPYFLAVTGGAILSTRRFYRTERGHLAIDKILLKLPVFGDLLRKAAVARFTRTLGTLLSSGVPILEALAVTGKAAGNKVVEQTILAARQTISQGRTLAEPLMASGVFPPMVGQMLQVGETTGAIDTMLGKIADFYEDEVDTAVTNLTSLMEPLIIIFLGLVIGGLVIAMYLPIFQLGSVSS
ncbi:MAG: type II secretion system F family protein [Deltaproteobacteria bacterium]|nr:type II secretion system F family protein [Deltaproteobacteria bacterium]